MQCLDMLHFSLTDFAECAGVTTGAAAGVGCAGASLGDAHTSIAAHMVITLVDTWYNNKTMSLDSQG